MKVVQACLLIFSCLATLGRATPVKIVKRWHAQGQQPSSDGKTGSQHLLSKLEGMVQTSRKASSGLSPAEKDFIEKVQGLWHDEIMPAIYASIAEGQAEIDSLFRAILSCELEETTELDAMVDLIKAIEDVKEDLRDCALKESDLLEEKNTECNEVTEMKTIYATPPDKPGSTNEERLQYLKDMNDYFCGTDEEFEEKMEDCDDATANHTNTSETCTDLQNELEELLCRLQNGETGMCMSYKDCRNASISRYEAAVEKVKQMEWEVHDEYIAAVRIECMWDAWNLSDSPCLVDEEYVEHCYNEPIDLSNLTITYPIIPDPHECTMSMEKAGLSHGPEDHPCTEEYLNRHYGVFDIDDVTLDKMKDVCKECPVQALLTTATTTELDAPVFVQRDVKCPHFHGDRIFRFTGMTLETCYQACKSNPGCQHLAFGANGTYAGVCMGCIDGHWQEEDGFNAYSLPPSVAAANLHYVHHDDGDDKMCSRPMFNIRGVTTPQCYEHCKGFSGCLHFSFRSGTCSGCGEPEYEEASGYTVYDLTDLGLQ